MEKYFHQAQSYREKNYFQGLSNLMFQANTLGYSYYRNFLPDNNTLLGNIVNTSI